MGAKKVETISRFHRKKIKKCSVRPMTEFQFFKAAEFLFTGCGDYSINDLEEPTLYMQGIRLVRVFPSRTFVDDIKLAVLTVDMYDNFDTKLSTVKYTQDFPIIGVQVDNNKKLCFHDDR